MIIGMSESLCRYNLRFIIMSYFHSLDKEAKSVHQIFILGHRLELDE